MKKMKTSRIKFVSSFLILGFSFLFLYNVIILSVVRLIPQNGMYFLGTESLMGWKHIVSTMLYPIKIVVVGPVLPLINLPDPPPPFLVMGFAFYWTILALLLYSVIERIKHLKPTQ